MCSIFCGTFRIENRERVEGYAGANTTDACFGEVEGQLDVVFACEKCGIGGCGTDWKERSDAVLFEKDVVLWLVFSWGLASNKD